MGEGGFNVLSPRPKKVKRFSICFDKKKLKGFSICFGVSGKGLEG